MMDPKGQTPIRVLLVEDHLVLREGTRWLLEAAPDLTVVGEAAEAAEAVRAAQRLRPDVVLLDLRLAGGSSGFDAARSLLRTVPEAKILVLTGTEDPEYAQAALKLGIRGYMLKTATGAAVVAAIRQVHAGGVALDPEVTAALAASRVQERRAGSLTERERSVLGLLAVGKTNQEIGDALVLSIRTAEWHVAQLLKKLDLPSRPALVAYAAREARGDDGEDAGAARDA